MNRLMRITAVAAIVWVAARAHAGEATTSTMSSTPTASSGQGIRICYVDVERITEGSQMIRDRVATVQKDLEEKQKTFKSKSEDLRQLTQQLSQQESVLTATQVTQLKERIRNLQDDLDRLQYDADRVLKKTGNEIIEPVLDDVLASVERVAQLYKVDLILRSDALLYASERVDLTDAVIQDLDRKLGATKPAVSPASTPARRSSEPATEGKKTRTPRPASGEPAKKSGKK